MRKTKTTTNPIVIENGINRRSIPRVENDLFQGSPISDRLMPILMLLLEKVIINLKKPITAIKYQAHRLLEGIFDNVKVPWFKLTIVLLAGYVLMFKDMNFNIALKAPFATIVGDDDESESNDYMAQTVANTDPKSNPYAPVSSKHLTEAETKKFIKDYAPVAIKEMNKFGIPASIKMAQALVESRAGKSRLARNNNNFFGIKCFSKKCRKGHCTNATDDHHKDFFRKFGNDWESFRAHSKLLSQGRYKKLHKYGKDYKKWATGLRQVGYATDKRYDKKLINIIKKYKLYKLDK